MKKQSTGTVDQDIPELTRDQLGKGVRGKYLKRILTGSNVVVLDPENAKAFPTSAAVNEALSKFLTFARETQKIAAVNSRRPRGKANAG